MQTLTQIPTSNQGFKFQPRFPPPNQQQQNQFQKNNFNMQYQFKNYFRPNQDFGAEYDGKRLRKSVMRKTVDYNSAVVKVLESRIWQRDHRDRRALQPDHCYYPELVTPAFTPDNPINAVTTKFVRSATNKMRCPIFCLAWTPEGRRLVTGASSGEFTLWNGLTFNFETILQAHDSPVRTMVWSHSDVWMVTGDHGGYIKYWQSNMNNVKMFQAHKEAVRGLSFSPSDQKFATCSDDGTVRIWDFLRCYEERIMRGHGADVKCVEWHPQKGLVVSGSKDNQQPIKLWDPKTGQSIATLHAHKSTVMDLSWNQNGNWLITASRDHLLKLFDIRKMNTEMQIFRGHKKEASSVAWHPVHEGLFCSGGSDGALMFWHVGADKEVGAIEQAHDSIIWALAWHPLGHILCSGSNDHTSKFWTRNRPGDKMRDKYNLNTLPGGLLTGEEVDEGYVVSEEPMSTIPGMGPEDKLPSEGANGDMSIPGLDFSSLDDKPQKKVPFAKPIPKSFQQQWNEAPKKTLLPRPDAEVKEEPMGSLFSQDDKADSGSKQFLKGQGLMGDVDHRVMGNKFGDQDLRQGDEDKDYRSFRRMEDMDMRFSDDLRSDDSWGSKRKRMDGGDTDDRWMKERDVSSHFMGDNAREDNSSFNSYPPQGSRQFPGQGFNMLNSQRGGSRSQRGGKSPRLGPWGGRKDSSVNKSGSSGPRPGLLGEHPGDHESGYLRGGMSAVEGVKGMRDDIDYDRSGQGQGTGSDHNKRVSRWSNNDNHFDKPQSRKGDHPSEFDFPRNFESNSFEPSKNRTFEPTQGHGFEGRSSATGTRGGRGMRGNPFYNRGGSSGGSGGFHSRGRGGRGRAH